MSSFAEVHNNIVTARAGCDIGSLNCGRGNHNPLMETVKRGAELGSLSKEHKYPISLDNNSCQDNAGYSGSGYAPNMVSTGLRLSYEENKHNSSITFPGKADIDDNLKVEIDQQKKELDFYIKFQVRELFHSLFIPFLVWSVAYEFLQNN